MAAAEAAAGTAAVLPLTGKPGCPTPGGHLVLRDMEGCQKVFRLGASEKGLRMGKYADIPVEVILGTSFGAALRRSEGGLWLQYDEYEDAEVIEDEGINVTETNELFTQDNTAQSLSPDEITELKGKCSGEDVVAAIASSSATFASKTKFSQEKYLRKKQRKHVQQVVVLRPSVMELCEAYLKNSRQKMSGLRFDYLSSILCQADIRHGARIFILDCAQGLVTGAIAQRLAGSGRIFRTFMGGCSDKGLLELDLGEHRKVVQSLPLDVLQSPDPCNHEWVRGQPWTTDQPETDEDRARREARQARVELRRGLLQDFEDRHVDAVVIVAGDEEAELAAEATELGLAHLSPGGRLVVFGQHLQPMAARQGALRSSGQFVDVRLTQLFTREFQVLPQRTHPHMAAEVNLCEGFLLAASKVASGATENSRRSDEADPRSGKRQRTNGRGR